MQLQWNLYKADTIDAKKNVRFIEIFSKKVCPQSKAIRSRRNVRLMDVSAL